MTALYSEDFDASLVFNAKPPFKKIRIDIPAGTKGKGCSATFTVTGKSYGFRCAFNWNNKSTIDVTITPIQ